MARPSLKDVRTKEILDAYIACIGRYGVDGTTLEMLSEASGHARPLLRHYLGNRTEMFAVLLDHAVTMFDTQTDELIAELPETGRLEAMMDMLFDASGQSLVNAGVFQALVSVAHKYQDVDVKLMQQMARFEAAIAAEIVQGIPGADPDDCRVAAMGIAVMSYNVEAVLPLNPSPAWIEAQRRVAERLLDGLRS